MSVRSLSRRLARTERQRPVNATDEQRAYLAFVAAQYGLPVAELAAETAAILNRARQRGLQVRELMDWLAAESETSPAAIWAEAAAWWERQG
jgi:hypothetical protein